MSLSLADKVAALDDSDEQKVLSSLTADEIAALEYDWSFWGRPEQQVPPGDWVGWLLLAGRGWGKTLTGGQFCRTMVERGYQRGGLIAPTVADIRDVMVEGQSDILSVFPPHQRPLYEPSKRRLTFHTGATAILLSADEPERARGPQYDFLWLDEICAWRYLRETWDLAQFGLRLGPSPRWCATTTPKPKELILELVKSDNIAITTGSTYENINNLAQSFRDKIISRFEGTRLGRQEIHAEILESIEGALWTWPMIERARWKGALPDFTYVVIAVDPSVGGLTPVGKERSPSQDECGIVVVALGADGYGYVLLDRSLTASPDGWASVVEDIWSNFPYKPNWIVAEKNNGGKMVEDTIKAKNRNMCVRLVSASAGKRTRAEPVSMLYERGMIRHVGIHADLETQMTQWSPTESVWSPDRMDALVWGLTKLMIDSPGEFFVGVA